MSFSFAVVACVVATHHFIALHPSPLTPQADMIIVGRAGAGMVEATFSGSGEMKQLAIDPALLKAGEDEVASIKVLELLHPAVDHGLVGTPHSHTCWMLHFCR